MDNDYREAAKLICHDGNRTTAEFNYHVNPLLLLSVHGVYNLITRGIDGQREKRSQIAGSQWRALSNTKITEDELAQHHHDLLIYY